MNECMSMGLIIKSSWLILCLHLHLHRITLRKSQATITPSSTIPVHRPRIYPAQPMLMHGARCTVHGLTINNSIAHNKPNSIQSTHDRSSARVLSLCPVACTPYSASQPHPCAADAINDKLICLMPTPCRVGWKQEAEPN